ncbi:unnamed protein product [Pleuronectes platessa]|uniref:Uncharacterized protein n=1 Tax=Pleuronectes platessa TaxID=8262 RepID=A0A9N7UHL9_PLEPL|nr:unnamed protein product [Pleuronectes platessa]
MSDDLHPPCESCLGPEHAGLGLTLRANCAFCKLLTEPERRRRAEAYAGIDGDGFASQRVFRLDKAIDLFDELGPESADSDPRAQEQYPPADPSLEPEGSDDTETPPASAQPTGIGAKNYPGGDFLTADGAISASCGYAR